MKRKLLYRCLNLKNNAFPSGPSPPPVKVSRVEYLPTPIEKLGLIGEQNEVLPDEQWYGTVGVL